MDVDIEPATPVLKKPPPMLLPGKNVFLEAYTDSPEWTRFENPVIHMEEEILPEELDEDIPDPLQDGELLALRGQGQSPGFRHQHPRQHPLSQVTNADDVWSSPSSHSQALGNRQQEDGHSGAPVIISDDDDEDEDSSSDEIEDGDQHNHSMATDNLNIVEEELFDAEGDSEEEPQDDTFEFLLR